jgi:hypothetical protein
MNVLERLRTTLFNARHPRTNAQAGIFRRAVEQLEDRLLLAAGLQVWGEEEHIGGVLSSAPAVSSRGFNQLDVFYRGQNNHLWHRAWNGAQRVGDGAQWTGEEDLGGVLTSNPAAVSWGPNRIDTFYRGQNNHLWHRAWNGAQWTNEEDLGGVLSSAPTVASWGFNRLDVFYRGQNNHLWHRAWNGAQWTNEEDLGGVLTSDPAAVSWGFNRIDIFYRGQNNHLWHRAWNGARWTGEEDLGGVLTSSPAASSWGVNRLDIFYRGQNNHLWHRAWNGAQWVAEEDVGGVLSSDPAAVSWGPNHIDTFYRGQNNGLWHRADTQLTVPALSSNPAARAKLYIDFDGYFEKDWWGPGQGDSTQPVFDMDGDPNSYSAAELQRIQDIWRLVADDYSPFNIDVTTVNPGDFSDGKAIRIAVRYGSYGGVSDINAFTNGSPNSGYASGATAEEAAVAISHEAGHMFGLEHQRDAGDALERPIMYGVVNNGRSVWWVGTNESGNQQDDVAVIARAANGFGFRPDDVGDTSATAASLLADGYRMKRDGIIEQLTDVDFYRFHIAAAGYYMTWVDVVQNLNARLRVFDAQGHQLADVDPATTSAATKLWLTAGDFFLAVSSHGGHGSQGMYTVGVEEARVYVATSTATPAQVTLTFNKPIDVATFTAQDVRFFDAAGHTTNATPTPVAGSNNQTWALTVPAGFRAGYRLEVGPDVRDRFGNLMDQDRDWVVGESIDDRFVLGGFAGPRVLDAAIRAEFPVLGNAPIRTTVLLTFSKEMDVPSLMGPSVTITGPVPVSVVGVSLVSGGAAGWTYALDLLGAAPGTYRVTVRGSVTDTFGNLLDQDGDGRNGEALDDVFTKTLNLAFPVSRPNIPRLP